MRNDLTSCAALQIRALGRTEVFLDGKYLSNTDWKTLVSRDLLYCLIAHPNGLTRDEIGAIFWPDATPGQLKTRFKNSIYRLHAAVGGEIIIYEDDLYRVNQFADYEYDVDAFQDQIPRAEHVADPVERAAALRRAVEIYGGEYCPEIEDEWASVERARLERLYRHALLQLATQEYEMSDYAGALTTCEQMTRLDSCWEEAHRLAMSLYGATGNRAEIVRQFEQCRQALDEELNLSPSEQTVDLFHQLTLPSHENRRP